MSVSSSTNSDLKREDSSPVFQGEQVSFTGTLASMTHDRACELVEQLGGQAMRHVSKHSTMLVIGEEGWPLESDGKPSQKFEQVSSLNATGLAIRIVRESDWLRLTGLTDPSDDISRECTPAMLSSLLNLPVGMIRRWERLGLIQPVRQVHRLPYFDLQEVNNAQRLSELLESGASAEDIERALTKLGNVLRDTERSIAQLNILVQNNRIVLRDEAGLLNPATGQRLLDFDPENPTDNDSSTAESVLPISLQPESADNEQLEWPAQRWFEEACCLADEDHLLPAIEAFRLCLIAIRKDAGSTTESPHAAEVNFHLADTLYRSGNTSAAVERYYCAIECDSNYLEAWTQLGCILLELNDRPSAINAFRIALDVHPEYADAHWHLANALFESGFKSEAITHWQHYLTFDQNGPWADRAQQHLQTAASDT